MTWAISQFDKSIIRHSSRLCQERIISEMCGLQAEKLIEDVKEIDKKLFLENTMERGLILEESIKNIFERYNRLQRNAAYLFQKKTRVLFYSGSDMAVRILTEEMVLTSENIRKVLKKIDFCLKFTSEFIRRVTTTR